MIAAVPTLTNKELIKKYPIDGLLDGWFFRYEEIAFGIWRVEGIDRQGRSVARTCFENKIDATLKACAKDASKMECLV